MAEGLAMKTSLIPPGCFLNLSWLPNIEDGDGLLFRPESIGCVYLYNIKHFGH